MFSWCSKKQQTVAQSSAEAEYVAAALGTSQAIWIRRIFEDIGEKQLKPTTIFCDSMSAIAIAKNPVHHSRTKHIALKHHFIREAIEDGEVKLEFCGTNDQLADIFTKALPREKFQELKRKLGVQPKHITGRMYINVFYQPKKNEKKKNVFFENQKEKRQALLLS